MVAYGTRYDHLEAEELAPVVQAPNMHHHPASSVALVSNSFLLLLVRHLLLLAMHLLLVAWHLFLIASCY